MRSQWNGVPQPGNRVSSSCSCRACVRAKLRGRGREMHPSVAGGDPSQMFPPPVLVSRWLGGGSHCAASGACQNKLLVLRLVALCLLTIPMLVPLLVAWAAGLVHAPIRWAIVDVPDQVLPTHAR